MSQGSPFSRATQHSVYGSTAASHSYLDRSVGYPTYGVVLCCFVPHRFRSPHLARTARTHGLGHPHHSRVRVLTHIKKRDAVPSARELPVLRVAAQVG